MSGIIDEKTKLPLGLVISIFVLFAGMIGTSATSHYRLTQLERDWESTRAVMAKAKDDYQAQELKVQRLDLTLSNIDKKLDSIEKKIDRMERK